MATEVQGWALLLLPAFFWLGVAVWQAAGAPDSTRRALAIFAWGALGFPLAFGLQWLVLHGSTLDDLPTWLGTLAVLGLVGPSEEVFKAAIARYRFAGPRGFETSGEARMAGFAAAAGYTFLEHFGRFVTGHTPLPVLVFKATLGSTLHALASTIWSPGLLPGGAWFERALAAGVVHGIYNLGAFLPDWTDQPQWLGLAVQAAVVVLLTPRLLRPRQ